MKKKSGELKDTIIVDGLRKQVLEEVLKKYREPNWEGVFEGWLEQKLKEVEK